MGFIAPLVGLLGGGGFLGGILGGGFLANLITNVLLGAVQSLFSKKPEAPGLKDAGLTQMVRQAITGRQIVYGRVKKAGPVVYMSTTNNNKHLHLVVALASHQCEEIESVFFNETELPWNKSTGEITSGDYAGKAQVFTSLGSDSQATLPELLANIPDDFTANHRLRGICYVYAKLTWDSSVYQGVPNISVIMKGKNDILDTRTSTTGYTNNAALCTLDYLLENPLGLGVSSVEYDSTNINAEANICDELVPLAAGGNEKRYVCDGIIETSVTLQENINRMLTSTAGKLTYRNGKFFILTGTYRSPSVTLTNDDIIGGMQVNTRLSRQELFNGIKGVYISPDNDWQPSDFPPVKSDVFKSEDNGERIWRDIDLPFTQSSAAAQRLAKIMLLAVRQPVTVSFQASMKAFQLAVGDTVLVDDDDLGWSGKSFEVVEWQFIPGSGKEGLSIQLALREIAPAVYSWDTSEETTVDTAPNTNLPTATSVTAPSSLTLDSSTDQLLQDGATIVSRILTTWDISADAFVTSGGRVEVEFKKSADSVWTASPTTLPGDSVQTYLSPVSDGDLHDVRVRFRNNLGVVSAWTTSTGHTVIGKTAVPSNVTNFNAVQNGAFMTFQWEPVSDIDLAGYEIRVGPQSNTSWEDARPLIRTAKVTTWTTSTIPIGDHTVLIKAIDTTGNESTTAGLFSITVSQKAFTTDTDLVLADDGWTGVLDNMLVHGSTNSLVCDSITEADSAEDIFDNNNVEFFNDCAYTWPEIDLGADQDARISVSVSSKRMPDTTGVANPKVFIRTRAAADPNADVTLSDTNIIQSAGTFSNMIMHHTGKLVPDSQDLASVSGTFDEYVQNAYTTCEYTSPEFDLGADTIVNLEISTVHTLGPGETSGISNVTASLDYKLAAGAYDGFESWASGQFSARYFKIKLSTDTTQGKSVIDSATMALDKFVPFSGVGEYEGIRYVQVKIKIDTTEGVPNITDYTITVDSEP